VIQELGGDGIDNLITLCKQCHKKETMKKPHTIIRSLEGSGEWGRFQITCRRIIRHAKE
jgi:hypothetical protein